VCTGGVFEDTKRFVRLYPIPLRYLQDERVFEKYQWIEAHVRKSTRDPRPESYNIRCEGITVGETIPSGKADWSQRAQWVLRPDHIFRSVEALQAARDRDGTSIGVVKPKAVTGYRVEAYSEEERRGFWARYRSILAHQELRFRPEEEWTVRPLPAPEVRFQLLFRCDDPTCTLDHISSVCDWEVDTLYNSLRRRGNTAEQACQQVIARLRDDVCSEGRDTYFFLGNMAAYPRRFSIVGLWYPKRQQQRGLFDHLMAG
jgi:hypothetical protein